MCYPGLNINVVRVIRDDFRVHDDITRDIGTRGESGAVHFCFRNKQTGVVSGIVYAKVTEILLRHVCSD